jgi:hypothetical protein
LRLHLRKTSEPSAVEPDYLPSSDEAGESSDPLLVADAEADQGRFDLVEREDDSGYAGGERLPAERPIGSLVSETDPIRRAWAGILLDNLLALSAGSGVRSIVIAAAAGEPVNGGVVGPLVTEVENRGLSVLTASLETRAGRSILSADVARMRRRAYANSRLPAAQLSLVLPGGAVPEEFRTWLGAAHEDYDLVIIAGPPLDQSPDSPLLARACDGLVLIAEAEATSREDLRLAADRSRATGCNIFGVVVKQHAR